MSVAFNPATAAASIAAVSISGVTVLGIDAIPQGGGLICPVLLPQPGAWLSEVTQGAKNIHLNDAEDIEFSYTLHYAFLFAELGSGVGEFDPYNDLIVKLQTVIQTLLSDDTLNDSIDLTLAGIDGIGVVQDPSEVDYWGALISLRCTEQP
jgi:hypothetical protein